MKKITKYVESGIDYDVSLYLEIIETFENLRRFKTEQSNEFFDFLCIFNLLEKVEKTCDKEVREIAINLMVTLSSENIAHGLEFRELCENNKEKVVSILLKEILV